MAAAFRALRVLLGLFFLLAGAVKLSERLSADAHRQMQEQFVRFAEVFPLRDFGFAPSPGPYLTAVGAVEAAAGLLLAFGPQLLQEISNFVLSVVMIGGLLEQCLGMMAVGGHAGAERLHGMGALRSPCSAPGCSL
uniref:Transmembrane protein 35B n=1 Tax=Gallus gallus TaxID=9031 RepID=A0A8V0YTY2_CHICK